MTTKVSQLTFSSQDIQRLSIVLTFSPLSPSMSRKSGSLVSVVINLVHKRIFSFCRHKNVLTSLTQRYITRCSLVRRIRKLRIPLRSLGPRIYEYNENFVLKTFMIMIVNHLE